MIAAAPWLGAVVLGLIGVAVGACMALLAWFLARRVDAGIPQRRRLAALVFILVAALFVVLAVLQLGDPRLVEAAVSSIAARVIRTAPDLVVAVVVVVAGIILSVLARSLLARLTRPLGSLWADRACALGQWAVIVFALIVAARQIGLAVGVLEGVLLVVVGGSTLAVAVGMGLGSRDLLAAVVAGRHVTAIIGVGDEVEVDGMRGRVLTLGRASVRLDRIETEVEIPNARFLDRAVIVHRRSRQDGPAEVDR